MNCDPERSEGSVVDVQGWRSAIDRSLEEGLLERQGSILRLTARGRLLSNEVFARFLMEENKQKKTRQTKTKWEPVT
jgi:coproporphyrinogen III oxidase-like Fe-S oxidoreductase